MSERRIGIDAVAIAVPEGYLELADLAEARGVAPGKYVDGLGVRRMSVARAHEDPVALAANAARRALSQAGVDPRSVGLCIVGTESGVDHSKAIAAWVHGLCGLPQDCRSFETKQACFGGTAGLLNAVDWIASGSARGRKALVVCTDIARYQLSSPGEPTQGAGAVAMIVSQDPRLVALEVGLSGAYTKEVNDFWRPLYSKEAYVDGHLSVQCYLDAITGAYTAWKALADSTEPLARRLYHVPYGKMARKAHRQVMALEGKSEAEADATYETEVARSLDLPGQIGNVYTGSLYLALASLVDAEAGSLEGKRIGFFSYGSGCTAEFFAGRVVVGAGDFARKLAIAEPLEKRRRLTVAEYEAIRHADNDVDRLPVANGDRQPVTDKGFNGEVAFAGVERDSRVYSRGTA
jgi:hydroxymethylglutaryl-CoA synthase